MTSPVIEKTRSRLRRGLNLAANAVALIAIAWACPRVDRAEGGQWLLIGVICAALPAIWAVHEQQLLGRPRRAQAVAGLRFLGAITAWVMVLVAASFLIGRTESPAPIERLLAGVKVPGVLEPFALPVVVVVAIAIVWSTYRSQKRREAELRQQGLAERAAAASDQASAVQ